MKKENKGILITAIFLLVTTGNYFRTIYDGSVRNDVQLSILIIGVLSGMLMTQVITLVKNKNK